MANSYETRLSTIEKNIKNTVVYLLNFLKNNKVLLKFTLKFEKSGPFELAYVKNGNFFIF